MGMEIIAAALTRVDGLDGFDETVLAKIARKGRLLKLSNHQAVFRRGEAARDAYVVLSGAVGLCWENDPTQRPAVVAEPGSVLGAGLLLDGGSWPVDGITLSEAILFTLGPSLRDLFDNGLGPLSQMLCQRLRRADALQGLESGDSASRLSDQLPEEFYIKEHTCPCCGAVVASCAVRSRFLRVSRTDADFYQHFEGPNPYFYEVIICDACGYAFDEVDREPLNPSARKMGRQCSAGSVRQGFSGPRTLEQAVLAFRRALDCQHVVGARASVRARTSLRLAWLHRSAGDEAAERKGICFALQHYLRAFELETPSDVKRELHLMYLVGELYRRLGERGTAVQWFSRVIAHPRKDANPQIVRMARAQWQETRQRSC